jgi:hypothetical protein
LTLALWALGCVALPSPFGLTVFLFGLGFENGSGTTLFGTAKIIFAALLNLPKASLPSVIEDEFSLSQFPSMNEIYHFKTVLLVYRLCSRLP